MAVSGERLNPEERQPIQFKLENLLALYSDDIEQLDEYQRLAFDNNSLLSTPVPEVTDDGEKTTKYEPLCWNNAVFDDEIEERLEADEIYQRLMKIRQLGQTNEYNLLRAMRSRRTILALKYTREQ